MITPIDTEVWTASDLTGNSAIVPVGPDLYVVGGRRGNNTLAVYRSVNHGFTWLVAGVIPAPEGTMDPSVVVDDSGLLQIVTAQPNLADFERMDIVKFTFNTVTHEVMGPVLLIEGSKTVSAYDVLPLPNQRTLVVASAMEPLDSIGFYVLRAFNVAPDGTFLLVELEQSHWSIGDAYGGISLIQGAGAPVELYYTQHPKTFTFRPTEVTIFRREWPVGQNWAAAVAVGHYVAQFSDDKLTVVPLVDGRRVVTQAYHLRSKADGRQTTIIYGLGTQDPETFEWSWLWRTIQPTSAYEVKEPVVETDGTNIYLLYLQCQRVDGANSYNHQGTLTVVNLDPATMIPTPAFGAWQQFMFKWLRGTKYLVETASQWMAVGIAGDSTEESGGGGAMFFSQFNLAPHAALAPATLTLLRGVSATLDASGTTDPDLDSLTYAWSHNCPNADMVTLTPILGGRSAYLVVAKGIGPLPVAFTVTVAVSDGLPGHDDSATCVVTVPLNVEPVITLPTELPVIRNTTISATATVTDADGDEVELHWQQIEGTPIQLRGITSDKVTAEVYRVHPDGEDIVLRLFAEDGINRPVYKDLILHVEGIIKERRDVGILSRLFYTVGGLKANISQRNIQGSWPTPSESELRSDLFKVAVTTTNEGNDRFCYTSPLSAQVISQGDVEVFYRSCSPSVDGGEIWDSAVDELEHIYVLTNAGTLLRFTTEGPNGCSDWADEVITLADMMPGTFSHIVLQPSYTGKRIIAVYGRGGILLLQVDEAQFTVLDSMIVDLNSGMLPSNDVRFFRMDGVQSLKSGQIFVGVNDEDQGDLEVVVDLSHRRVVGSWDRSKLLNRWANTGEFLAQVGDYTEGTPDAPTWNTPALIAGTHGLYNLSWVQVRPDLVAGYEVWIGQDALPPSLYAALPGGALRSVKLQTKPGHIYHLTVRSQGKSAMSSFSVEYTLSL